MNDMDWKKIDCGSQDLEQPQDGGPAFPLAQAKPDGWLVLGMSMRDYFASAALTGILASDDDPLSTCPEVAAAAYRSADAMLKEREKRQ